MLKRTRGSTTIIAAVTIVALVVASVFSPLVASATTSSEKQHEADAVISQLNALQDEVNAATAAYNEANVAHDVAVSAMNSAQAQVDAAEAMIASSQTELDARAVSMYRNGRVTLLDVCLGASSFSEFITTWALLDDMNAKTSAIIEANKAAKAEAEAARNEFKKQEAEAAKQLATATNKKNEMDSAAAQLQAQINSLQAEVAELEAQEELAAEAAAQAAGATGETYITLSGLSHPCPGYSYVSSSFGWRSFDNAFHMGIDYAAPSGTPIYAVSDGTVIIAGYGGSAGNWVVIAHGDGLVTKYMHATEVFVSAGQTVSAGTCIASVGSTGNSTGPHLHFQMEVNGNPVDPALYI